MKRDAYRNGKIPGRRGYGLDDDELVRLFDSGLKIIEIAGKMGISQWTVLAHLRKLGLRRNKRHHITRPDAFSTCSAGSCYWAGFLAADGCVSSENEVDVELGIVDAEHLRTLCGFVGRDETLWFRKRERMRKGKPRIFEYASVGLRSARIVEDLRTNFKVVPRKSLVLEPPDVPQPMLRHFIRGIFDGDGSVGWHKHNRTVRFTVCSGSKRFVEWIRNILFMELGDLGMRTIGKHGDAQVNTLDLTGDAAVKVFEWMYSDGGEALCLKRKREKFLSGFERLKTMRAARASGRQATVDEMSTLYIQGLSYGEIAARLGATKGKVSYYLRGVDIPKRAGRTDSPAGQRSRERDQGMLASHLAGEGADGIAARFGIAESSFWVAIRRAKGPRTGQTGQG